MQLTGTRAFKNGMVELRYEIRCGRGAGGRVDSAT
jgi:hypothetical protein